MAMLAVQTLSTERKDKDRRTAIQAYKTSKPRTEIRGLLVSVYFWDSQ